MTRLLFCFYAEKTGIFETPKIFTNTLTQYTIEDGSDLTPLLDRLFRIMDVDEGKRPAGTPAIDLKFPYVNGSLFDDTVTIPQFSRTARRQLLECGDLDWTTINPDIFGSMIQTIAEPGARGDFGMHYTSRINIMKALQPLFLDDLNDAYDKAKDSVARLHTLIVRLSKIRVFDPACGSGNFLIIAYKELRQLEMRALLRISDLAPNNPLRLSGISLHNFYGVDIVDFACETAKLSLWIAEYQMNSEFKELFGTARPPLPLGKISTIHNGNAVRIDWLGVCPPIDDTETFICGNPPYQGAKGQSSDQRADVVTTLAPILHGDTNIDYVSCWFVKLTDYIAAVPASSGALVATNSICQGEQVAFLWPYVFSRGLCITFAHTSFKWANSAAHNAGVTCVIVGIGKRTVRSRSLYTESYHISVPSINAYLVPAKDDVMVTSSGEALNGFPEVVAGSQPKDGGNLTLSPEEKERLLARYPAAAALIRRYFSAEDVLYRGERYTLWISDAQLPLAQSIPPIAERLRKTRLNREAGGRDKKRVASTPHRFAFNANKDINALAIPGVSSERRLFLQVALIEPLEILSHTLHVVYSPPPFLFALLSSRLHRIWAHCVGGKLEDRLRYSGALVYNTFPVPQLSDEQKRVLGEHSRAILKARAKHPGKTLADLYNPETMPANLLEAHQSNDAYLEEYVYGRKFRDDTHRLEHLFSMYAQMKEQRADPALLSGLAGKVHA
jgi:hypothetical protein